MPFQMATGACAQLIKSFDTKWPAVVRALAVSVSKVDLVEMMKHAVHGVEDGAVGVVLRAAVLIHQMVTGSVLEGVAALLVARRARPILALPQAMGGRPRTVRGSGTGASGNQEKEVGPGPDVVEVV
jgi:hypothetical protein